MEYNFKKPTTSSSRLFYTDVFQWLPLNDIAFGTVTTKTTKMCVLLANYSFNNFIFLKNNFPYCINCVVCFVCAGCVSLYHYCLLCVWGGWGEGCCFCLFVRLI